MSGRKPLISIATISFNQKKYLQQAIDSVVQQTADDTEYLMFDGGSSDGSREVIESQAESFSFWQSCVDGGPASALQQALQRSRGEYFMYLNSDDFLLPGAIDSIRDAIQRFPKIDVFYGNGLTLDERRRTVSKTFSDRWNLKDYARGAVSIFQQSCALRRESALEVGGFNTQNWTCWDGELLFDMGRNGATFARLGTTLAVFRLHQESISGSQSRQQQYYADRRRMAKKIGIKDYHEPNLRTSFRKAFRQPDILVSKLWSKVHPPRFLEVAR